MAKEYSRTQRIGDQMQRELAQLIRREIKDPRVGLVTITAVEVSRDVSHAKIFITVMGQDSAADIAQNLKVLNDASGFLRMQLGRSMQLRNVPQLHFHFDASVSRGAHLSALIERAVAEDSQRPEAVEAAASQVDSKADEADEAGKE
jgi:ribosome-binding factor A